MRIRLIYFFAALFCFNMIAGEAIAKEKRYTVKVYGMDTKAIKGVLKSVDDKGLYILIKTGEAPKFIDATQIKEIKLRRKGKSGRGSTIGFITGAALGAGGVAMLHNTDNLSNTLNTVGAVVVTFIGSAIGGAIGSRYDETILINGRTEDYLQTLQHLKSFAPLD